MRYIASVLVKAIVDIEVVAESHETALAKAEIAMKHRDWFSKGLIINTASERITGIQEADAWDEVGE
jgi:2-oxoglutarate dehydrogenase complex dehydrogenase (E1) component-like enzyme